MVIFHSYVSLPEGMTGFASVYYILIEQCEPNPLGKCEKLGSGSRTQITSIKCLT